MRIICTLTTVLQISKKSLLFSQPTKTATTLYKNDKSVSISPVISHSHPSILAAAIYPPVQHARSLCKRKRRGSRRAISARGVLCIYIGNPAWSAHNTLLSRVPGIYHTCRAAARAPRGSEAAVHRIARAEVSLYLPSSTALSLPLSLLGIIRDFARKADG